jgi:hypothetical protein
MFMNYIPVNLSAFDDPSRIPEPKLLMQYGMLKKKSLVSVDPMDFANEMIGLLAQGSHLDVYSRPVESEGTQSICWMPDLELNPRLCGRPEIVPFKEYIRRTMVKVKASGNLKYPCMIRWQI